MSTSPQPPPAPMFVQPVAEDYALRDVKIKLSEALTKEWYRANQAGHANRDYSERDAIKASIDQVQKWKPAAPAGGASRGTGKGRQVRPPAVERADRLMQMLADIPQLDPLLAQTSTVADVMKEARTAQERMNESRPASRWRNPFARYAALRSPGTEQLTRRQPAGPQSAQVLPARRRAAPAAPGRSAR
jgi:hypothetical protein